MIKYRTAQICQNGHMITSSIESCPELKQIFCSKCGAKTITACPSCNAPLFGDMYDTDGSAIYGFCATVKSYCHNCGKAYPWTESVIQSTTLLIQEEDELTEQLKNATIQSLPDIVTETPATNLAVIRIKKCLASAGKFTADGIRQFVIDFGCELAEKSLGL